MAVKWDAANALLTALATALAAVAAAFSSYYAFNQVNDARNVAEAQAVASLSSQASDLYDRFSKVGIDDVPRLTAHLYLMWTYRDRKIVSEEFYVLQARTWCALTRASSDKLKINWQNDPGFRSTYSQQTEFLSLLDRLIDKSSTAPKDCL